MSYKNDPNRITKIMYQRYLDELGYPEGMKPHIKSTNATKTSRYGQFLRRADPVQFEVGFNEWKREMEKKRGK